MSNRSTTGGPKVPYYRESDVKEAAKFLRVTLSRFLSDRASMTDVRNAWAMLEAQDVTRPGKMPPQVYECGRDNCPGTTGTSHRTDACPGLAVQCPGCGANQTDHNGACHWCKTVYRKAK